MKEKDIMRFQVLEANLRLLTDRQNSALQRLQELHDTLHTIEELEAGVALIPIGSGNFVHGKITDTEKILVGMGAGVAVEKTREEAKEIIKRRISEVEKAVSEISKQVQQINLEIQKLQEKVQVTD